MKKVRNMFALALILLSVVSIGSVAGTYAKYTSTGTASDTARVAKWMDFENNDTITLNLFNTSYEADDINATGNTVVSTDKVIAPGTTNIMPFAINVASGDAPEVAYKITFAKDSTTDLTAFGNKIQFRVDETGDWGTLDDAITALNTAAEIQAPNAAASVTNKLEWRWVFEGSDDSGDVALATSQSTAKVVLKVTATQVD